MHGASSLDAIPAAIAPSAEGMLPLVVGIVDRHRVTIEEAGLAGIALFGDGDRANALSHQESNDGFRGEMQLMSDATIPLVGESVELMGSEAVLFGQLLLQMFALLIVALVDRLEHTTVNQHGYKARLV